MCSLKKTYVGFFGAPLKTFKPNMSLLCAVLVVFEDLGWRHRPFLPLFIFSLVVFNCAFFLQSSHVTLCTWFKRFKPVKSRSNLSVKYAAKIDFSEQRMDRNLLWCTSLRSAFSHRYLMSALGGGDVSSTSVNIEWSVVSRLRNCT